MFKLAPVLRSDSPHPPHRMDRTLPPHPAHHLPERYALLVPWSLDAAVPAWSLPVGREVSVEAQVEVVGVIAGEAVVERIRLDVEQRNEVRYGLVNERHLRVGQGVQDRIVERVHGDLHRV